MLRCFIVRELNASTEDAFLMDINDSELRFTIREFSIVSGLKCAGDLDDFKVAPKKKNMLMKRYFGDGIFSRSVLRDSCSTSSHALNPSTSEYAPVLSVATSPPVDTPVSTPTYSPAASDVLACIVTPLASPSISSSSVTPSESPTSIFLSIFYDEF
ncbi:hypothetical protein RND71_012184 [Anisodus tanguticus]|uniref:DUF1985 domain-containing protein n=1 Tax=Anisodus tanguticus TaxID=243964 RepID=A0AAE1VGQ5_9SOLA|nr:hypothetical protein RND71_012184 [Anisodus tanguticus]